MSHKTTEQFLKWAFAARKIGQFEFFKITDFPALDWLGIFVSTSNGALKQMDKRRNLFLILGVNFCQTESFGQIVAANICFEWKFKIMTKDYTPFRVLSCTFQTFPEEWLYESK